VFACFIDFKKAFDSVKYWKLFNKLMDDGINTSIVALLAFWYSHQEVRVRWHNVSSDNFLIYNGTPSGTNFVTNSVHQIYTRTIASYRLIDTIV